MKIRVTEFSLALSLLAPAVMADVTRGVIVAERQDAVTQPWATQPIPNPAWQPSVMPQLPDATPRLGDATPRLPDVTPRLGTLPHTTPLRTPQTTSPPQTTPPDHFHQPRWNDNER